MRRTLLALLITMGHAHAHNHGNPDDLSSYIAKMEDPSRAEWQKPDQVIATIGVGGKVVCDIGAGPGYFSLRMAKTAQHVFAVDVEPRMLAVLRERLVAAKLRDVTPVLSLEDDPLVPAGACDVVLVVDSFHHFPDGVAYLRKLRALLKPGGRLVNIDFHKRELPVGPPVDHKIAREDFLKQAQAAGLQLASESTILPYQYFLIFK